MASDTLRQVTGVFKEPNGDLFPNRALVWRKLRRVVQAQGTSVILDEPFHITTDASGEIDTQVVAGNYVVTVQLADAQRSFNVVVPDEVGPHDIADILDGPVIDDATVTQIQALVDEAEAWAENPEDDPVETGKFSALHWSAKSEGYAGDAATQAGIAEGHADDAQIARGGAETAEAGAGSSADAAAQSAADALAAANAAGPTAIVTTKAAATAGTWAEGDVVEVMEDEDNDGRRTRYVYTSGALVFVIFMDTDYAAILLSRRIAWALPVPPAAIETLLAVASAAGVPLILDKSITLTGDVLWDEPVHVILPPSVTVSMANNPTLDTYINTATPTIAAGMFVFRPGSEGSVFEAWGTFQVNYAGAGNVESKGVRPAAVLVYNAHHITLKGTPTILGAFNGVTAVDSDHFQMLDPWYTEGASNAGLDAQACDHGYARIRASECEEVIDLQYHNRDWEIYAWGSHIIGGSLGLNNAQNVRAYVKAYNCCALQVDNYEPTDRVKWSSRVRDSENENLRVSVDLTMDAGYTAPTDRAFFNLRRAKDIHVDGTINITGIDLNRPMISIADTVYGGSATIKLKSDTRNGTQLYTITGTSDFHFKHDTNLPMSAGDIAVQPNATINCIVETLKMNGQGAGINVSVPVSGTNLRVINSHIAENVDTAFDTSTVGSGPIHVEPYLEGTTAERPSNPASFLVDGQQYKDTDIEMMVSLTGSQWSYTEQTLVATTSSYPIAYRGFAAVTGALSDGTAAITIDNSVRSIHPLTIYNNSANPLTIWRSAGSGDLIDGGSSKVLAAGVMTTFKPHAGKWISVS